MSARRKVMEASSLLPAGPLGALPGANGTLQGLKAGGYGAPRDSAATDTIDPTPIPARLGRWKP